MVKEIRLMGFGLTNIEAKREPSFDGQLEIKSNIKIENIEKADSMAKQDSLKIYFTFEIEYLKLGRVSLQGNMFIKVDVKSMKKIINDWKTKKIEKTLQVEVLNIIIQRASLKALQIEQELGLPPHIRFPRLRQEQIQDNP